MLRKLLTLSILLSLAIVACKKDDTEEPAPAPPPSSDLWGQGVSASVYGTVTDENGAAVAGATVNAGGITATTDAQGVFRINDFNAYQNLGYVKVAKQGYFLGSRSFVPLSGGNRVNIRLLSNTPDGSVSSSSGSTINDANSAVKITLPANGIVKNNAPYNGAVQVAIRHIDTQSDNFSEEMPGNLIGVQQNNQSRGLLSYGMVAAELTDNAGQPLQLAANQTATVRFPISAQQQATAPASIDLWSFDEQNGYWKHEGTATKQGSEYVAQVSHFSFWNCDIPGSWITLNGTITNTSGQPIPGATVTLNSQTSGTASDYTNAQGQFSGWVPSNQPLTMTVKIFNNNIDTTILVQGIGPFNTNTTLNPIALAVPGVTQLVGTLVCNNNPVTSGYVLVSGQVFFANASGQFSFPAYGTSAILYPFGINPTLVGTPQTISLNANVISLGNLNLCNGGGGGGVVNWGQGVSASVYGTVTDENGAAVAGTTVNAGGSTATTDAQGVFRINGFNAFQNLGYVKVEKQGYFPGSRSFVPVSGGNRVNIRLLSNAPDGSVSSSSGSTISDQTSTASVTLPASGIVKNNAPYNGTVRVAIRHIDTQSDNFSEEMPGNLIGVQNNQSRGLISYGMVAAELTDNAGQPLQLAAGQTATVRFPIAAQQLATAPNTIDLWSFDEQNGYWKHEGTATKQGSEYVAQVSHFSFWNCDIPGSWITLNGTITNTSGQPVPGATVTLNSQSSGTASDYTNAQGQFSGWVPAGQSFTMTVQVSCGGNNITVLTQSVGPYSTNSTLNPIAVTVPGATQVTGTLVCNGNPVTNGYVVANGQVHFANAAGQFSFSTCGSGIMLYPYATNPFTAGTPVTIPANGTMNNVTVCSGGGGGGTGTVTDIDGNTYNTVQIGTQEWMQENLKTTKYKNGDLIPNPTGDWSNLTTGAWAYYNDSSQYNNIYGKLYNWYAVTDARGVCPIGWHVPTDSEWNVLVKQLDSQADTTITGIQSQIAGGFMKAVGDLQSGTGLWQSPNQGATNSSGFTGLPGGNRATNGNYDGIGIYGNWWSTSETNIYNAWFRTFGCSSAYLVRLSNLKQSGWSVRCLRD